MIASLLEFSLRQRILVLGLACLLSVAGVFAFQSIPIDAYPDVTNIQAQILTDAPGLSPVEVERFITYPLEHQMTGLPGLAGFRPDDRLGAGNLPHPGRSPPRSPKRRFDHRAAGILAHRAD